MSFPVPSLSNLGAVLKAVETKKGNVDVAKYVTESVFFKALL